MAVLEHPGVILVAFFIALFIYYLIDRSGKKSLEPTNWPFVGMLPGVSRVMYDIHQKTTNLLQQSDGSFWFKGPWFCNMDLLVTCNPQDINHILSKNFGNYPKGLEFKEKFEILGDGVFCTDFGLWEIHRSSILSVLSGEKFYRGLERSVWQKIDTGLIPVLGDVFRNGGVVDLQDIFQRFAFDNIFLLLISSDPGSLLPGLPEIPCQKAFGKALQPLFQRHVLPRPIWKTMRFLKIGQERKLLEAWKDFDEFIYSFLTTAEKEKKSSDVLQRFTRAYEENRSVISGDLTKFLRDTLLSLLFAGSDTSSTALTWLFHLLCKHPSVERKVLDEIESVLRLKQHGSWRNFTVEESHKLVYLHAAICETVRLFPPLALQYKSPLQADVLPSGHRLGPNTRVILAFFSVGRMESLWGKDCLEFRPERWITAHGALVTEPSYKFPAFNVGPRSCLGKEMAFAEIKMVAAAILYHYKVQLVEGHPVVPRDSIMLHAKNGLKVHLAKRNWNE